VSLEEEEGEADEEAAIPRTKPSKVTTDEVE
jgi:hypothetical protein